MFLDDAQDNSRDGQAYISYATGIGAIWRREEESPRTAIMISPGKYLCVHRITKWLPYTFPATSLETIKDSDKWVPVVPISPLEQLARQSPDSSE